MSPVRGKSEFQRNRTYFVFEGLYEALQFLNRTSLHCEITEGPFQFVVETYAISAWRNS